MPDIDMKTHSAGGLSNPVVSICIPTFNGSNTIEATLKSCLEQTYNSIEIIISDDNSSDETLSEISKFNDSRIVVLPPHVSSGAANNWNRTISAARGRFIKMMGQDDLLSPNCIQTEIDTILGAPGVSPSFCFSTRSIIDDSNVKIIESRGWIPMNGKCSIDDAVKQIVRSGGNPIGEPVVGLIDSIALRMEWATSWDSSITLFLEMAIE